MDIALAKVVSMTIYKTYRSILILKLRRAKGPNIKGVEAANTLRRGHQCGIHIYFYGHGTYTIPTIKLSS
jgi:hypothetical protein